MGRLGHALGIAAFAAMLLPPPATPVQPDANLRSLYARPAAEWPPAWIAAGVAFVELGALTRKPAADQATAWLGARLFHDTRLSRNGDMSCATCHAPSQGWADGRTLPIGQRGAGAVRHVPSLFNAAYRKTLGWDGAGVSLAAQSLRPLTRGDEMGNSDLAAVVGKLAADAGYGALFVRAFGDPRIDPTRIAAALAAFQSGLEQETRFDAFARGDHSSLSDQEIRGLHLFRTKAGCANCHHGSLLTDERFHNLGLSAFREPREDLGRHLVTRDAEHAGQFRTPSLRHVWRTAPYMHNGLFPTLEGIVNFYARGGGEVWARNEAEAQMPLYRAASRVPPFIRRLELSVEEKADLVAFLRAL